MVVEIPLSKTGKHAGKYTAIVDDCDADLADFNWAVQLSKYTQYAIRWSVGGVENRRFMSQHRIVLSRTLKRELLPTELVDHINGDGLDNRRKNLRVVTPTQNQANQRKASNNKTGYKGVSYTKGKWKAYIGINRRVIYLGSFNTPEEAHAAYCKATINQHGEFARLK